MNIISLFSDASGLDLGFHEDKEIWETFETNFFFTTLDRRSIINIP